MAILECRPFGAYDTSVALRIITLQVSRRNFDSFPVRALALPLAFLANNPPPPIGG